MKKIIVLGGGGQLASELEIIKGLDNRWLFLTKKELDVCNIYSLRDFFSKNNCDLAINCSAYTNVDKAEEEIKDCYNVNQKGVENLIEIANKYQFKLIHISTDYVFDGEKSTPYNEQDHTSPNGVYGKSKLAGEKVIVNSKVKSIIIRTSWLYSNYGNNFVKTILDVSSKKKQLGVVYDQLGSPTFAKDLAEVIIKIVNNKKYIWSVADIFHYSNEGCCSWYDFALEILRISNIDKKVEKLTSIEFPTKALRPKYSLLSKGKIKKTFGIKVPDWRESLEKMLEINRLIY